MSALEGSFETSVPYDTISTLVREQLDKGGDWNVVSYSVDGTGDSQVPVFHEPEGLCSRCRPSPRWIPPRA